MNLISILVRIFLSIVIGGALGVERERKRQPAGFRTHILVCLGSALVMMTNQYIFVTFHTGDVSRLGAQVISGIGFLGAGTIILTGRSQVLGLTTAAGLWAAACVGLAIGIGFYEGAIAGGITIFCAMTIFHKMNDFMRKNSKRLNLYLEIDNSECLGLFLKTLKENGMNVANMQFIKSKGPPPKTTNVFLSIDIRKSQTHKSILLELQKEKGVILLQEL